MGSDRARETFDRSKQYRRVVAQQGRVELEADKNEGAQISTETLRYETIDIVGPYGVPSDPVTHVIGTGYQIGPAGGSGDFAIGPGILYLGGWRVEQENPKLTFAGQAEGEWLDGIHSENATDNVGIECIVLHLSEHEVSAVEDRTLREVALGGPDTCQRMRLRRRVRRFGVTERSCEKSFEQVVTAFEKQGFDFDPRTMQLSSLATLLVTPDPTPPVTNPCDPVARGGYLGADNQMIRVQIADKGSFLWSYDNGSSLYAVTVESASPRKLVLGNVPVDVHHWPKSQQYVEVLVAASKLGDDGYAAADFGHVFQLAADYDPDLNVVLLGADVPQGVLDAKAVFLRVWENRQDLTLGTKTPLVDKHGVEIGIAVTIAETAHPGEHWSFSVRPGFPQDIYPPRYAKAPQPPEGPRQWLAPLGWIDRREGRGEAHDCRPVFDGLVQLTKEVHELEGGCCTITVKPIDVPRLQTILDDLKGRGGATICFMPGIYELTTSLRLGRDHAGLTLEAPQGKAILRPHRDAISKFPQGMIEIVETTDIALRNLELAMAAGTPPVISRIPGDLVNSRLSITIGVRVVSSRVTFEGCTFRFGLKDGGGLFGAGIFGGGVTSLEVRDCVFDGTSFANTNVVYGILMTSTLVADLRGTTVLSAAALQARLERAVIEDNEFKNLTGAVAVTGASFGRVHVEGNEVQAAYNGFAFLRQEAAFHSKDFTSVVADNLGLAGMLGAMSHDRWLQTALSVASFYPLPEGADFEQQIEKLSAPAPGKTFESIANVAAESSRKGFLDAIGASHDEAPRAASPVPGFDLLNARREIEVPVAVNVAATAAGTVLWNLEAMRPAATSTPVATGGIHIVDNDVDLAGGKGASAYAIAVWDPSSTVVVSSNRATNMHTLVPTVSVVAGRSTVTGNAIVNYAIPTVAPDLLGGVFDLIRVALRDLALSDRLVGAAALQRVALSVAPYGDAKVALTAITGNLCEGIMRVPARPSPLPAWPTLNTVVP